MDENVTEWLLACDEPWTRYRTRLDLLDQGAQSPEVLAVRAEMLAHPQIVDLIGHAGEWPGYGLKRHNDAKHPLYALSTLADFGLRHDDPGISPIVSRVMSYQSEEGAFQTKMQLYKRFHGSDDEVMSWASCDAPTLLYALGRLGLSDNSQARKAQAHLVSLVDDNGWRCRADPLLGPKFRGPGRREDPCPIANVYGLKVLAHLPEYRDSAAAHHGVEMLLDHWENR